MKKFLIIIIEKLLGVKNKLLDALYTLFDFFYAKFHRPPRVATVDETIAALSDGKSSIARFGDGEIKLVAGQNISFQQANPFVTAKMREVLSSDDENLLIGIADIFGDRSRYEEKYNVYWKKHLNKYRRIWYKYLNKGQQYYNASFTRQYISLKDKNQSKNIFEEIKKLWDGKDIVFIEGEKSRLGVGNDLFDNARSIRRIIGPSSEAFSKYDKLLLEARKLDKDVLFLLALGPCATALAYDLHKAGYRAIDIGHIDVEYEWFLMHADERVPLKNKMVHEAGHCAGDDSFRDDIYNSQIIATHL